MIEKRFQSKIEELVHQALELWHVPGLALAVVRDGQVLLCEGFGLRNVAGALPVTPGTLFPIASCTKAFTAMSVAMLVDDGLIEWDKPVKYYLSDFKMWDDCATQRLTPRDLLSHRSGLPGHDMMWFATQYNRREIFERLHYLEPTCDFRTTFQYQNLMYVLMGVLIDEIAGIPWEKFVQTRIFGRLGMKQSNFSTQVTQKSPDFATPYLIRGGKFEEIPFFEDDAEKSGICPAGGICSCVEDMALWVQLQLNQGRLGEETLVSQAALDQMHSPHIFIDDPHARRQYGYEFTSYGMGWGMRSHKGEVLLEHDGMTDGFYSLVSLMPRRGIGIVALSNADAYWDAPQANLVPNIISYSIYDRLLGLETTDWNALMRASYEAMAEEIRQMRSQAAIEPESPTQPSLPIDCYLGDFEHPGYGIVSARKTAGGLQMVVNDRLILPLRHVNGDTFKVYFEMAGQWQKFAFLPDAGRVDQVSIAMEPRVKEILFNRIRS